MKKANRNKARLVKISKIFLIIFITIFITLATAETYFVLFNPQGATDFWKEDEYVGIMHKPNMEDIYSRKEFSIRIKINSAGFRDKERSIEKDNNTIRIAILGDSLSEAFQVPLEKSFPYLLEEKLNNNTKDTKYEVLNFGVSSIGTAQEYLILKQYALKYKPDIVILAFFTANDVFDNSYKLQKIHSPKSRYFVLDKSNRLVESGSSENKTNSSASSLSVLRFLRDTIGSVFPNVAQFINIQYYQIYGNAAKDSLNIYCNNYSGDWQEAWNITEAFILATKNLTEENGAKFILVSLANNVQVNPNWWNETLKRYPEMANWDTEKPDKILEEFSKENNINYIKLLPYFKEYYNITGKDLFFHYDFHWNEEGHSLAADVIGNYLKSSGYLS